VNHLRQAPVTVAITALCLILAGLEASGVPVTPHLALQRGAVSLPALLLSHFVHLNAVHLAWNAGGLFLLGLLYEPQLGTRRMALLLLAGVVVVDVAVLSGACGVERYAGSSGVATALFVCGALEDLRHAHARADLAGARLAALALTILAAKIAYEIVTGRYLLLDGRVPGVAVPGVHVAGSVVGLVAALLTRPMPAKSETPRLAC
jgi:membrane associated rhomboid family serine protease